MSRRLERVNMLLREEISRIVSTELTDPRLMTLRTITRVESSADLSNAKVYVSAIGKKSNKNDMVIALNSASGIIRKKLHQLKLKKIPSISFLIDESLTRGDEVIKILDDIGLNPSEGSL